MSCRTRKATLLLLGMFALIVLLAPDASGQGLRWGREYQLDEDAALFSPLRMKINELRKRLKDGAKKGKDKFSKEKSID